MASAAAVAALAVLLALGVRLVNADYEPPADPFKTSATLTIGVVADPARAADAEMLRGVRTWARAVARTRGIPYPFEQVAPVRVVYASDGGSPGGARAAVRRVVARGASIVFGPPDPSALAAVADQAQASRILLLAPRPRPMGAPRSAAQTFLSRRTPGEIDAALDVVDRLADARRTGRAPAGGRGPIVVLHAGGFWARQAELAARLVRARGYTDVVVAMSPGREASALGRAERARPVVVVALGEPPDAVSWFRRAAGSRAPWVLAADDASAVSWVAGRTTIAVSLPYDPRLEAGGSGPSLDGFARSFRIAHGRDPGPDAAAGAAMGVTVSEAVALARGFDSTRLLKALARLDVPSFWGRLRFRDGTQEGSAAAVVLLDGRRHVPLAPNPTGVARLRRSVPPA